MNPEVDIAEHPKTTCGNEKGNNAFRSDVVGRHIILSERELYLMRPDRICIFLAAIESPK